jgi:hypothetical protein
VPPRADARPQLEYFGRPLGLWRTSHKLAHTLSEVTLICAWAAALSLCFDNFFTSVLPCASLSAVGWYDELQRPSDRLPAGLSDAFKRRLCADQVTLIILVGLGLLMYCTNLIIRSVCGRVPSSVADPLAQPVPHLREGQASPARLEPVAAAAGDGKQRQRTHLYSSGD